MLTFEQAFKITDKVSSTAVYYEEELRLLFDCAMEVKKGGMMMEIGCEYGRSTSLLLRVAKERDATLIIIDKSPKPEIFPVLLSIGHRFQMIVDTSDMIDWPEGMDFLHIDGAHEYPNVKADLERFATLCAYWTVCHNYHHESLPDVTKAVDEYVATLGKGIETRKAGSVFAFREL